MASTLLLISSPPNTQNAHTVLQLAHTLHKQGGKIGLFLLQDGVYCALAEQNLEAKGMLEPSISDGITCFYLQEDLEMRGYKREDALSQTLPADYAQLVDFIMQDYDHVMGAF
ncbi:MAG: DsrE family protein [Chloroflexi bacterium]|nr:DsrE family protein [Chloroflexota bacterium]MCL5076315.1 DsrE family protein [Chloroflexota bacterium]